jgi:hypothetical protein
MKNIKDISGNVVEIFLEECELDEKSEAILDELIELFQGEEEVIHSWLNSPRLEFGNKTAFEIMKEGNPTSKVLIGEYIYTLKTGDFS